MEKYFYRGLAIAMMTTLVGGIGFLGVNGTMVIVDAFNISNAAVASGMCSLSVILAVSASVWAGNSGKSFKKFLTDCVTWAEPVENEQ